MILNQSAYRKMCDFFGREIPFNETESAYKEWRKAVEKEDNQRLAEALTNAPKGAYIVTDIWEIGSSHLRKGEIVFVKEYPCSVVLTSTRGSMQGIIASSNWHAIKAHTVKVEG